MFQIRSHFSFLNNLSIKVQSLRNCFNLKPLFVYPSLLFISVIEDDKGIEKSGASLIKLYVSSKACSLINLMLNSGDRERKIRLE